MANFKTLADILTENNVSFEQASKVTLIESNGKHFAKVESQTTAGTEYTVEYNPLFKVLTCNCPAGQEGRGCWHRRATLAQIAIDKMETRKAIEATRVEVESRKPAGYIRANKRYGGIIDAASQDRSDHERGVFHLMR